VLGGVLIVLGSVISAVGTIMTAFGAITLAVSWPMVAIAVAIGAVIAIGVLLAKNWDKISASAKKFGSSLKQNISSGLSKAGGSMQTFFTNMIDGAKQGITKLFTAIKAIFQGAVALIFEGDFQGEFGRALGLNEDSPIIAGILAFRDKVIEIFGLFVEAVKIQLMPFIWIWENIVFPVLFLAFAIISRILFEIYNVFVVVFTTIGNFLKMVFEGLVLMVTTVFTTIMTTISMILNILWIEIILPIMTAISEVFTTVWNAIKEVTFMVFNAIWASLTSIWNSIYGTISSVVNAIFTIMSSVFTKAKTTVIGIFNALWSGLKAIGQKIFNAITDPFVRALRKIEEIATKIKETAKKISPFHKSSPSLVELVDTGVRKIKRDYASLNNVKIPSAQELSGVNSFDPLTRQIEGTQPQGSTTTNTFNVEAVINSDMDAEQLALILGAQLATAKAY
jgi:phage-related protein